MVKKKRSSLFPLLAIAAGLYLLNRSNRVSPQPPIKPSTLPQGTLPQVQRVSKRRLPIYL